MGEKLSFGASDEVWVLHKCIVWAAKNLCGVFFYREMAAWVKRKNKRLFPFQEFIGCVNFLLVKCQPPATKPPIKNCAEGTYLKDILMLGDFAGERMSLEVVLGYASNISVKMLCFGCKAPLWCVII